MRLLTVKLMPWKWGGAVLCGGSPSEFKAWAKKHADAEIETGSGAAGHAHLSYGKPWLIWVHDIADVPCLAHEALHITAGLLEARGLKFSDASEEAYTYTLEDILRQVLTAKKKEWARAR